MKTAFIIHGAYGSPNENWIPYLKKELESKEWEVKVLVFPTPEAQNITSWFKIIDPFLQDMDVETILIGHSIGATFILHILEKLKITIKASYLVSGFLGPLDNPEFDELNKTFLKDFDWIAIKKHSEKFYIYHSDNDPYVPIKEAEEISDALGTKLTVVKDAGHFNTESGYIKFERLLEDIK
ncbi:hypothetical protein COB18_01915 [Candidatus Kaiserbacteria bacterium]|nr:MAG: hypothetical protein COB18_01915 [Candidatus Kaiserbacteria bacterium]